MVTPLAILSLRTVMNIQCSVLQSMSLKMKNSCALRALRDERNGRSNVRAIDSLIPATGTDHSNGIPVSHHSIVLGEENRGSRLVQGLGDTPALSTIRRAANGPSWCSGTFEI